MESRCGPRRTAPIRPRIRTIDRTQPTRLAYGSCRTAVPHDEEGNRTNGVDALRALALAIAAGSAEQPDLIAFPGTRCACRHDLCCDAEYISERRSLDEPPGRRSRTTRSTRTSLAGWTDAANRWLLSTVPSCMILDDHDIRDDWNTSWTVARADEPDVVVARSASSAGLASYWVYQHSVNLSPAELREDEVYARVRWIARGRG